MPRLALIAGLVLAALVGGAPAHAVTTTTPPTTTPTTPAPAPAPLALRATLDSCQVTAVATNRSAVFSGSMPSIAKTWRMRMRFDLYTRRPSSSKWKRVTAAKWGVWHVSRPRVPGFVFTKVVDGLDAPAVYRAIVQFRWYDKQARLLRATQRMTPTCVQPDSRPDLRLGSVTAIATGASTARYTIVVRNAGLTNAGPFGLVLAVGDKRVAVAISAGLAIGQQRMVTVDAPSCTATGKLSVLLDPENAVDEAGGRDVPVTRVCPL